jgi:hypothetical protein
MEKDVRFGIRNVRGLSRAGSLLTVAREFERYKSDLEAVQGVRWDKEGNAIVWELHFFTE